MLELNTREHDEFVPRSMIPGPGSPPNLTNGVPESIVTEHGVTKGLLRWLEVCW